MEEGARGGVGPAKQNIEGSQRQDFCAGGAPPTSPDRLKLSLHPSQPENVKNIARKKAANVNPDGVKKAEVALNEAGIKAVSFVSENTAHEFLTWRRSLLELAPLLFQK